MGRGKVDLLHGTLDLLILKTLTGEAMHGWAISKRIRETSRGTLNVHQGSLYPALYRLRDRRFIEGEWGISPEGRRARFYRLTAEGHAALAEESRSWTDFTTAVNWVLAT